MKVVVNRCFGGFSLSGAGILRYAELKGLGPIAVKTDKYGSPTYWIGDADTVAANKQKSDEMIANWHMLPLAARIAWNQEAKGHTLYHGDIERNDPALVAAVEELGCLANGDCASLEVVEIPDDVKWHIAEYDGRETVDEDHRSW